MCGELLRDETRTARKLHQCCACGLPIAAGTRYVVTFYVDGGRGHSDKWHHECRAAFDDALASMGEDCGLPSDAWEGNGVPDWLRAKYDPAYVAEADA